MCRVVTIGALAIGLATIGYAISLFMASPAQPPKVERTAIVVEGADVGETTIGVIVPVHIRIHNNSNVAIRFIGGPNGCQRGGCMKTTGPCPLTIDANSVADVPLDLSVSMLGSYQLSVCVCTSTSPGPQSKERSTSQATGFRLRRATRFPRNPD